MWGQWASSSSIGGGRKRGVREGWGGGGLHLGSPLSSPFSLTRPQRERWLAGWGLLGATRLEWGEVWPVVGWKEATNASSAQAAFKVFDQMQNK